MRAEVAAMHYLGMQAYRVQGLVSWSSGYFIVSVLLAMVFSALALQFAQHNRQQRHYGYPA
ncbi:MAG: MHYT domain-containing protein [Pseudomonas sp.]